MWDLKKQVENRKVSKVFWFATFGVLGVKIA